MQAKEARLALLNADLNIDGDGGMDVLNDDEARSENEAEQAQDEPDDNDFDEQDEPPRRESSAYNYDEPRTGTYGKAHPSILTDLETMTQSIKPPLPGGAGTSCPSKSAEIEI